MPKDLYHHTYDVVDRLVKASRMTNSDDIGSGWAYAVGMLSVYLCEAVTDLEPDRRREWVEKLERRCREIERDVIVQKLRQEETYENNARN